MNAPNDWCILKVARNTNYLGDARFLMRELELAERIVIAAQQTKAESVLLYDLQNRSSITDYIIICSGRSQAHVRGVANRIEEDLRAAGVRTSSIEGFQEGSWVLMDYGDVIVHIFHPETRAYYDLESLLQDHACRSFDSGMPEVTSAEAPAASS